MASLYRQSIFISTYWENLLNKFMEELNQFLSNLKFTYKASRKKLTFLDVSVSFKNDKIFIDIHQSLKSIL